MNKLSVFEDLSKFHTFRLPSKARSILTIRERKDVESLPRDAYVLGEGSNTLFLTDISFPIALMRMQGVTISETADHWLVDVAGGENWHQLVVNLIARGINGLENLALIPGTVGAAPVQNIGAYGVEVAQFIREVETWDRERSTYQLFPAHECQFGYRDSVFKQNPMRWIILSVRFQFPKAWRPVLTYGELAALGADVSAATVMNAVISIRQNKLPDPAVIPNAGSFFKNPEIPLVQWQQLQQDYPQMPHYHLPSGKVKLAAGWMIDQLQLKGHRIGGAAVHDRQALVLVNSHNAVGDDVVCLARYIQQQVHDTYGVELEAEVRLLAQKGLVIL